MGTGNGGPVGASQQELQELWRSKCAGSIQNLLLLPQGSVALQSKTTVVVLEAFDRPTVKHQLLYNESTPTALDFSAKGTDIIVGYANGFLKWWNTDTGEESCSTQFPYSASGNDATSPGGHHHSNGINSRSISDVKCCRSSSLLAAASNRAVCVFGPGGEHLHTLTTFTQAVEHLLWLRDNLLAAVEGSQVRTWGFGAGRAPKQGPEYTACPAASIRCAVASPSSTHLAAACGNGTAQVWTLVKGPPSDKKERVTPSAVFNEAFGSQINEPAIRRCMAWSASSRFLATAQGSEALVWDTQDAAGPQAGPRRESVTCLGHDSDTHLTAVSFQGAGPLLAAAADSGQLLVFDSSVITKGGQAVGTISSVGGLRLRPPTPVASISWTPQGNILAASSTGELVALKPALPAAEPAGTADSPPPSTTSNAPPQAPQRSKPNPPPQHSQAPAVRPPATASRPISNKNPPAGWGGEPLNTPLEGPAASSPHSFGSARGPRPPRGDPQSNGPAAPPSRHNSSRSSTSSQNPPSASPKPPPLNSSTPSPNPTPGSTPPKTSGGRSSAPGAGASNAPASSGAGASSSREDKPPRGGGGGNPETGGGPGGAGSSTSSSSSNLPARNSTGRPQRAKPVSSPVEQSPNAYWRGGEVGPYMGGPEGPSSPLPGGGWGMVNPMNPMMPRGWAMPMMPGMYGQVLPGMTPYMAAPAPGAVPPGMPPQYGKGMPPMPPAAGFPHRPGMPPMPGPMGAPPPHMQMQAMQGYMYAPQHPMAQWPMAAYPPQQWGHPGAAYGAYYYYPTMQTPPMQGTPRTSSSGAPPDTSGSSTPGTPRPARPSSVAGASDISALEGGSEAGEGGRAVVTLYVGNLAANVTEDVLLQHFSPYGTIQSVQIIRDRTTQASRGFGFVTYQHPAAAAGAMKHMNGQVLMGPYEGRAVKVSPSNRRN